MSRDILRTDPNFFPFSKLKSFCHDDDDVLLERAINPCSSYQVSTELAGFMLVSIAQLDVYTACLWGGGRGCRRIIRVARAVKKTFWAGFRCGGWLFCSACTIGMADGRLFGFCFYLKKSKEIKAKYNVPDVCVRRAVAVGGGI